jgi:serine/threonine-protein kinase
VRDRRPEAGTDPLLGQVLEGRYRMDAVIGRGGMGAVYRATHLAMDKAVAIKVVKAELASNLEAVRRFHREARAASLLSHPHTIKVFDFGETEQGLLYLAMEHLAGRTLADAISREGAFPEARAAHVAGQIAQSLAEAHGAGLVHRDLKPGNVMLVPVVGDPDFVKVLDFGIVKFLSDSEGGSHVTRAGLVIGSPHYMAPEQAQSRPPDPRTDLYSLGVILYEMLVGRPPFQADSPMGVLLAHVSETFPPIPSGAAIGRPMRDLVGHLTEKVPDRRPASAMEVLAALDTIETGRRQAPARTAMEFPLAAPSREGGRTLPGIPVAPAGPTRLSGPTDRTVGPMPPGDRPGGRSAVATVAVAVVMAVAAGAVWKATRPDEPTAAGTVVPPPPDVAQALPLDAAVAVPVAEDDSPASIPDAAVTGDPAAIPDAAAQRLVAVRFESIPAGATVSLAGVRLGVTPFEATLPASDPPATFTFELRGHRPTGIESPVEDGAVVRARLVRLPPAGARKGVKVIDF